MSHNFFLALFLITLNVVSAANSGINTGDGLYALRFPDVGQASVALPESLSTALPSSFSFEVWVMYPGTVPNSTKQGTTADGLYKSIVSRYTVRPDGTYHNMWADFDFQIQTGGEINFFMGSGLSPNFYGVIITAGTLTAGVWTHLAFSVHTPTGKLNPDYATVYVNGVPSNSTWKTGNRQLITDVPINLGAYMNQDGDVKWWRGYMDEIRIWGTYRSTADVMGDYEWSIPTNTPNLLAYYKCEQQVVDQLVDSAHNYDGVFVSGAGSIQYLMSGAKINVITGVGRQTSVDIELPGIGTNPFTYVIQTIPDPTIGSLKSGNTLILANNLPFLLPANVVTFQSTNVDGVNTTFSYYGTNSGGQEANSTIVLVSVSTAVCNPDACGVCNGDNSTCTCIPIPYNGYSFDDLERVLYLYEIEQTLELINQVEVQVDQALTALEYGTNTANLNAEYTELKGFNDDCLDPFDTELTQFVSDLSQMS